MKILHLVSEELSGGAARGAYWLHLALLDQGIKSTVLNNTRNRGNAKGVKSTITTNSDFLLAKFRGQMDSFPAKFYRKADKGIFFSTGFVGYDFTKEPIYQEADILHLHWVNSGFVDMKSLSRVNKPVIWTLRDMWPMTGGCHYSLECDGYANGCGNCMQLKSRHTTDLSKLVVRRKEKYIPKDLKVVCISNWLGACAKKSKIFNDFDIQTIYNGISLDEFRPIRKDIAKSIVGIKEHGSAVLVGAQHTDDLYKGFGKFIEAIEHLDKESLQFVFFGDVDTTLLDSLEIDYVSLGFLNDNIALKLAYSAADVFVAPSLMDAFGKTIAESLACGTPVVCFDATGPKEIVEHKVCGYKARAFDVKDLADGIKWVLSRGDAYDQLCLNARKRVAEKFDVNLIAEDYISLYRSIL